MTALGSAVRDPSGTLLAHAWLDSAARWWATGYRGIGVVTVPTTGPHPSRAAALSAVGVLEDSPGRGWLVGVAL